MTAREIGRLDVERRHPAPSMPKPIPPSPIRNGCRASIGPLMQRIVCGGIHPVGCLPKNPERHGRVGRGHIPDDRRDTASPYIRLLAIESIAPVWSSMFVALCDSCTQHGRRSDDQPVQEFECLAIAAFSGRQARGPDLLDRGLDDSPCTGNRRPSDDRPAQKLDGLAMSEFSGRRARGPDLLDRGLDDGQGSRKARCRTQAPRPMGCPRPSRHHPSRTETRVGRGHIPDDRRNPPSP